MDKNLLIAGGGIGGLAAALASARAGWQVDLLEQSPVFGEVGAGIQLGPNVVKVLRALGVGDALARVVAFPSQLEVRNATSTELLGVLPLGKVAEQRYGAPYVTIARADMHNVLLEAVRAQGGVGLHLDARVLAVRQDEQGVQVETVQDQRLEAPLLVGADGLWSQVRKQVLEQDVPPRVTGHLAFRAMLPQSALPVPLRTQVVTAWMGPDFHAVHYPVRSGEWLNMVCIVHGKVSGDPQSWDHSANAQELRSRMAQARGALRDMLYAIDQWRLWPLCDRPPMASAAEHAKGRIALLGDAAHPMRPYLAQGAGMAIEDAAALAACISELPGQVPLALARYAAMRWQRNARVQARAIRNGQIYHLKGYKQVGRDLALKALGPRLMDVPWLYNGP
ncbi:MAG: FAD-dependent monooxygenase [Rhodoferax sp.]|nr:FAD-dependent monooxygenase [Rhodoferax sp.]